MKEFVKIIGENKFAINSELLDLAEAQLWVGRADGPSDDDDERVRREREEDIKERKIYGIEAMDLTAKGGWFFVDVSGWPEGKYRLMIHSRAGTQSSVSTKLDENARDLEYSWPKISEEIIDSLANDQKQFIYREPNGRGFCFRIEISPDRLIVPAGK